MIRRTLISALSVAAVTLALPAAAAAQPSPVEGVWRNPKNSVHIKIQPCGDLLCGYVVWASEHAKEDAKKGGTEKLVGSQLLRNFAPSKTGTWKGKVFVPDLNATFSGSAELVDSNTLKARGCLFAGIACKSQNWKRIAS
jgi:uncharacterized protein (DUF2147 family)